MRDRVIVHVHSGAVHELQSFVARFAAEHRLAANEKARILIVIEELFTNLSRYGYPSQSGPEGVAEVTLELEGSQLTIEFSDDGQAFDPSANAPLDLDQPVKTRPIGGLGLHIVRGLADEAHYSRRDGRNVIRLSRRVSLLKRF
jgi:anti-sigma regulatory factor (Ser/Thr protein kinase)